MARLALCAVLGVAPVGAFILPTSPGSPAPALFPATAAAASASASDSAALEDLPWEHSAGRARSLAFGFTLGLLVAAFAGGAQSAVAADLAKGEAIFANNCAACHAGGNNAVQPEKKLKKDALTTYGMYSVEKIKYQVTNGKNAMPAFGDRLPSEAIDDVASYVITKADQGW
mmetsp:Transcript_8077/g.17566  ORF Transcript_8077/g.17566 Transcript_8077/m.17566 type:complete len:172 (-) Transcript_8077:208-723(-)|eukprot:CAMPEP_0170622796 /NCGR_PEP_ID=MMETSP0224-20130122/29330_1 /TAXON_ID=285029 /ORGANISM="Togula jolla, Strain CCCM 725" /LENGTH=171 /DNA_ID=CAMNT_0010949155 /DNA_START=49 /DNA_END=564 /DNA_ORIENTATION=-